MTDTVISVLAGTALAHGERPALRFKRDGAWQTVNWAEYHAAVRRVARAFMALGLAPGQGVAIIAANRPEWFLADLGGIAAGGLPAGIYTTSTPDQCLYVAQHCEAAIAVAGDEEHLQKLLAVRALLPSLRAIVSMSGSSGEPGVLSWNELLARAEETTEAELDARIAAQKPDALCTLIYTSGTTGPPKAVMLSHRNVVWTARSVASLVDLRASERTISYLPLSHIAEQIVSLHCPMAAASCTCFAESLERLGENLREVRPTFFFAVPRVWEKIQARMQAAGAANPRLKRTIAAWARRQGLEGGYAEQQGRRKPLFHALAAKLVFQPVRERLGLDQARLCLTSAAPISRDTLDFFLSLGIPILEVYGMSECTGPATISLPERYRTGKAGFALPGTELRIAEDGEILIRGPHVFPGYLKNEAATQETVDENGWLHSGDIGVLDPDGFLRITDRKKELIITSGGKNIGPQILEGKLKEIPVVAQAVVVGDRRNYVAALLTLDPERIAAAAVAAGSPARTPAEAAVCPLFRAHVQAAIDAANRALASYETIKRFEILPHELTIEGGELTPTMKLKRRVIAEKYRDAIERLYA